MFGRIKIKRNVNNRWNFIIITTIFNRCHKNYRTEASLLQNYYCVPWFMFFCCVLCIYSHVYYMFPFVKTIIIRHIINMPSFYLLLILFYSLVLLLGSRGPSTVTFREKFIWLIERNIFTIFVNRSNYFYCFCVGGDLRWWCWDGYCQRKTLSCK